MLEPRHVLAKLGLSESEIDIYLALLNGAQAVREVVRVTGRSRPTVYYALTGLENRGLLKKNGLDEEQRFRLEPLKRLGALARQKQDEYEALGSEVDQLCKSFQKPKIEDSQPQVTYYEGVTATRSLIMDTIYSRRHQLDCIIPNSNFLIAQGFDFIADYLELRNTLGVTSRNLLARDTDKRIIASHQTNDEMRYLPDGMGDRFRSSVFMFEDRVLYVSVQSRGQAVVFRSVEHYELMIALFATIWGVSTPIQK